MADLLLSILLLIGGAGAGASESLADRSYQDGQDLERVGQVDSNRVQTLAFISDAQRELNRIHMRELADFCRELGLWDLSSWYRFWADFPG